MRFCARCGTTLTEAADLTTKAVPAGAAIDIIAARLADERQLDSPRAAYFELGLQLLASGRAAPAADAFELAAKEEGPSPSTVMIAMALGQASAQAGVSDRALRTFLQTALDLPAMFAPLVEAAFRVLRGDSVAVQRHWLEESWLPQAMRASLPLPERGLMQAFVGSAMLMVGDAPRALEYFAALPATERNETWQTFRAQIGTLVLPASIAPGDGERALLLSQIAESLGETEAALESVDRALELGFTQKSGYPDAPANALRARLLERLGRKADAAESHLLAGKSYLWRNDTREAVAQFQRTVDLGETPFAIHWWLAEAYLLASYIPEPPFVDGHTIKRSLDAWNFGVNISPPDEEYSWAYLTRAAIATQFANLPEEDRWDRHWEAVSFVEQALLLNPVRALSWVRLGQLHYALGNDVNALHTTETALLCNPNDVSAIEERLFLLTNLNRFVDARPFHAMRGRMEPPASRGLLSAIEAHLQLYEALPSGDHKAYEAALVHSDAAIAEDLKAPWVRIDRAMILHLLGRTDDARQQYAELWHDFAELDVGGQLAYAWAALMSGEEGTDDSALRIFGAMSGDRVSGLSTVQRYLGFCRLLRGELDAATDHFDRAIALADSVRDLDAWLIADFESTAVVQKLIGLPHEVQARQILDRYKNSAAQRRAALNPPSTPLEELQRVTATLEARSEMASWNWVGAHAGTARLRLETHRWREAEESYRRLEDYSGRFHTAQHGLSQALYGLVAEEHPAGVAGDVAPPAADRESTRTDATGALPEDRTRLADIHDQREDLERRRLPTRLFGQTGMQRLPTTTPIAIEVAKNLVPLVKGEEGGLEPQFAQQLSALRRGLDELLGFTAPPVRVRPNEYLPNDTYVILLNEIPVVSGNLDLTRGLCNNTVDRLTLLNVKGQEAINPSNGSECAWVGQSDWQKVKGAGLTVWEPAEYIVLHLSAVIRKNAGELVGIQAVADLLNDKARERHHSILSAKGGLPRFTSVIQALLNEEVPVKELPSICDCYLESQNLPTYDIPEEIRCLEAVRKDILGNTPDTPIYRLGENLVSLIAKGIQRDGEAAVLALEPEPTQDALTAVRNPVANFQPTTRNPVLFVEDWHMRPFVRKLVELEFPHLAVLSRREALAPDSRPVLATIEVESRLRPARR